MMNKNLWGGLLLLILPLFAAAQKLDKWSASQIKPCVLSISEVMLHDVANPPAASRFYGYSMLAAYEVMALENTGFPKMEDILNQFPVIEKPTGFSHQYYPLTALLAMLKTGQRLMPSGFLLKEKENALIQAFAKKKLSRQAIDDSEAYANFIASSIFEYAKSDGYGLLSTLQRYIPRTDAGSWYPTPPDYMAAVEPNWRTIRPFLLDSAGVFKPKPPAPFNMEKGTDFRNLVEEVYQVTNALTEEQKQIANFWDCNPFAISHSGHMAIGIKKISPAGHWMNIAGIAAEKQKLSFNQTIQLNALLAVAMADAFISCWDEKYRSNRIRPITAINKYIDQSWQPLLQTPPFPEYTSGHSVVSTTAGEMLSWLLGPDFTFTDNSEALYGIPARTFHSFEEAANEASISRLYGGIHFRDALENGHDQGHRIGQWIISTFKSFGFEPIYIPTNTKK